MNKMISGYIRSLNAALRDQDKSKLKLRSHPRKYSREKVDGVYTNLSNNDYNKHISKLFTTEKQWTNPTPEQIYHGHMDRDQVPNKKRLKR